MGRPSPMTILCSDMCPAEFLGHRKWQHAGSVHERPITMPLKDTWHESYAWLTGMDRMTSGQQCGHIQHGRFGDGVTITFDVRPSCRCGKGGTSTGTGYLANCILKDLERWPVGSPAPKFGYNGGGPGRAQHTAEIDR